MSSRTSSPEGTSVTAPSRRVFTGRAVTRVSFSTARLARISWTKPMTVLMAATIKKVMFLKEPTMARKAASTRNTRLKKVKQCWKMICFSEGRMLPLALLTQPHSVRC